MDSNFAEFYIPVRVEDLENYEKTAAEGRYLIDEVQDVSLISADDQLATLRALFLELSRSQVLHVHESGMIGTLYSFVKALSLPGVVGKEVRALLAHECAEKLTRLLTHALNHIRRETAAGTLNAGNLHVPRSCTKMYVFVLCNVLMSTVTAEDGATQQQAVAQPIGRRPKRGRAGVALAADEDISGVDINGREQAVTALSRLFDAQLAPLWRQDGHVEDPVTTSILKVVLHLLSQKRNVEGDHNAVCGSIHLLLGAAAQSVCLEFTRAEEQRIADGTANTSPDPKDLLVTPLVELLIKCPFSAKFLARWIADIDSASQPWSAPLLKHLYEAIVLSAADDVTGDNQAAKNISLFMEELSKIRISFICLFPELTAQLLQAESYEIRKAGITVSAELLTQHFTRIREQKDELQRDDMLRELLSRMMDLNPFTRTHCVHTWCSLVKRNSVPKSFFLSLVESAVGRMEDKNYLVRNAALQLLCEIMRKNWFTTVLTRSVHVDRLAASTAELRKKFLTEGKSEEDLAQSWRAARASLRPLSSTMNRTLRLDADEVVPIATGDVEPDIIPLNADENGSDANNAGTEELAPAAAAEPQRPLAHHDADVMRLVYFENSLVFIGLVEKALENALELLDSKSERNVIEAIRFIVVCSEYRLEGSTAAVLRFLVMIFDGEIAIQQAVREGFYAVFFHAFIHGMPGVSPLRRSLASALKLTSVLRTATEGEVNAIDRLFRILKQDNSQVISNVFYDAVWSIVDGTVDNAQNASGAVAAAPADLGERRTALRLYSMLAAVNPIDVAYRRPLILNLLAQNGADNILLAFGFTALQHESLARGFSPVDDKVDPNTHPVLSLLVRHLCRTTTKMGSWMPLAEAAINAIHHLAKTPVILYTSVVEYIARSIVSVDVTKFENDRNQSIRVAQLLFVVGHTALKHLVSIDAWERAQLKALEDAPAAAPPAVNTSTRSARGSTVLGPNTTADQPLDVMHKELGMGSNAAKRHAIEDAAGKKRKVMLEEKSTIWAKYCGLAYNVCWRASHKQLPDLRTAAVLCLSKLMIVSEAFSEQCLPLLFTIASKADESWVVKTNVLLAIGDLACVHPNIVEPFLKMDKKGLFALLQDPDNRVRAVTVQICSHLVLSEMLRVGDRLHYVVRLVADPDPSIKVNAIGFVKNYAVKNRRNIGNCIPPLIPVLSNALPQEDFQQTLQVLLEKVEKDKPTESLIEKLCERFGRYEERSRKKKLIARNLAFCLAELDYSTERAFKKLSSEQCYALYRQWLRDDEVLQSFQSIAVKARKAGGPGGLAAGRAPTDRRDKAAIDEWEARVLNDAAIINPVAAVEAPADDDNGDAPEGEPEEPRVSATMASVTAAETSLRNSLNVVESPSSDPTNKRRGRPPASVKLETPADDDDEEDDDDDDSENTATKSRKPVKSGAKRGGRPKAKVEEQSSSSDSSSDGEPAVRRPVPKRSGKQKKK